MLRLRSSRGRRHATVALQASTVVSIIGAHNLPINTKGRKVEAMKGWGKLGGTLLPPALHELQGVKKTREPEAGGLLVGCTSPNELNL